MPTLVNLWPNFTIGTEGNERRGFIMTIPFRTVNKLLIMSKRSLVVLTGKNRLLGTFIPNALLKLFIAAPHAVSN